MLLAVGSGRIGRNSFRKAIRIDEVVQLVMHRHDNSKSPLIALVG